VIEVRATTFAAALAVGSCLTPALAQAATLAFEYKGACAFNCEEEGLEVGAPASGRLVMDDAGFTPSGFFTSAALIDFSFDFGGIKLDRAGAQASGFGGTWGSAPDPEPSWQLSASTAVGRFEQGPTISVGGDPTQAFGIASFLGTCETTDFGCNPTFFTAAQFELQPVAPIPLPAPVLLLGAGLAALAGLRFGRRQAVRAAAA
jgi:hypothetical protein